MSLFNATASAAVNAMEGHAIGRAIGEARDRAYEAEARTDAVLAQLHASRGRVRALEQYVAALESRVRQLGGVV